MYLIPYRLEKLCDGAFPVWRALVFLTAGGKEVWQTDSEDSDAPLETIVQSYFLENGLEGCVKGVYDGALFYEVSPSTSLSSFYTWSDFLQNHQEPSDACEVWRPLFWIGHAPGEPDEFDWMPCCRDVCLGSFGSCERVWMVLREVAKGT